MSSKQTVQLELEMGLELQLGGLRGELLNFCLSLSKNKNNPEEKQKS